MRAITALFYRRVEGIQHHVELVQELRLLGAAKTSTSIQKTIVGKRATEVQSRLNTDFQWQTISLDGCVLSLAGEFEHAALDLSEWLARTLCSRVATYSDLPSKIRDENLQLIGEALKNVGRPYLAHINYSQVIFDLYQSDTKGIPVTLFSRGFGMHNQNLRSEQLAHVFARSQVKDLWSKLGRNPWLRAYYNGIGVGKTAKLAAERLDDFMEYRNQVAHRGPSYASVGPTVVLDHVKFFRCLLGALALVLDEYQESFP
jgi:hypothetical protein